MKDKVAILERALERERAARKASEQILEEKSAELYKLTQQLQESNNKLHKLFIATRSELTGVFTNLADAYLMMDLSGNVLKMNEAAVHLLGFNSMEEEFNLLQLAANDDIDKIKDSFEKLLEDGTLKDYKYKVLTKYGEVRILDMNCSLLYNDVKKPVAVQGIFRDITKHVEAELELRTSKNRLSLLVQNLHSGIVLLDENNKLVLMNKMMYELFDLSEQTLDDKPICIFEDVVGNTELFEKVNGFGERLADIISKREEVKGDELTLLNGKVLERSYIPMFENFEFKGHLWTFNDITLKKNYRKSLEAERQKYSNIIANMNLGLVEVGKNNDVLFVNQSFCKMSGYKETELVGHPIFKSILKNENTSKLTELAGKRKKGISNSYELKATTKSGELRYWLVSGAPNYTIEGKVTGSIGIILDITDIKNLELQKEALVEKLEKSNTELQEYAHIVSHDLKSPLRSIYALVTWLKEDNYDKLDELSMQNFALIESTLEKMEQLITDILDYSSAGTNINEFEKVDINYILQEIMQILYVPPHITITVVNTMPVIKVERTKMQQLFQNLIGNAIKFIDKEEGFIEVGVEEHSTYYQFYVKDNGIGIEEKYHQKIFEIFHSLKKSKDSSGIGLSIVKKIIKLYGGDIWVESTPGEGAIFYFTIYKNITL